MSQGRSGPVPQMQGPNQGPGGGAPVGGPGGQMGNPPAAQAASMMRADAMQARPPGAQPPGVQAPQKVFGLPVASGASWGSMAPDQRVMAAQRAAAAQTAQDWRPKPVQMLAQQMRAVPPPVAPRQSTFVDEVQNFQHGA